MGDHAVATPHWAATEAAERALASGGNAIDAALAAAATLTVVYPDNCGLGGDMFALVRTPDGRTTSVNASGPAVAATDAERLRRRGPLMPITGPDTVTVPGVVAGWDALHALGAELPWRAALEPAAEVAAGGVPVTAALAGAIAGAIGDDTGMAGVFAPGGSPLAPGEVLRQPALAATLRELADLGARGFYAGAIGERLVHGFSQAGGTLTMDDLAAFEPELTMPLRASYGDLDVLTSPPNSSGVLLLQALLALDASGAGEPLGSDAAVLAEILRASTEDRDTLLGDARRGESDLERWIGPARIQAIAERALGAAAQTGPGREVERVARPDGDTVAIVAVDDSGMAVSLIQSLFHGFGARILEPATGIVLHNRGAMFSLEPGHPNELAAGRRPAHTLMPVLVERGGRLAGVLGTMGGKVHAQIHVQVLLRLLAGEHPQDAVDAPRWIVGGMEAGEPDDMVRIEEGCAADARTSLTADGLRIVDVARWSDWMGHAQVVWLDPAPRAGSDRRADGAPGERRPGND